MLGIPVVNQFSMTTPMPIHATNISTPTTTAAGITSLSIWTGIWIIGFTLCAVYFLIAYLKCYRGFQTATIVQNNFTIIKLFLTIALCIHWFNPLVWAMYILSNRDIEISCDEAVVRSFGEAEKSLYAHILVGMEEKKSAFAPF